MNGSCVGAIVTAAVLAAVGPMLEPAAAAARVQSSALDRVERLADRGEVREARQALERWERERAGSASREERVRAWYLAGRLADDGAAAEFHYLRVVIEGSATRYADDALLRLAQYQFAAGEYARAIEYLARLRREYPTSEHGTAALLWLARAAGSAGDPERACSAAEQGLAEVAPGDTALIRSLRRERDVCGGTGAFTVQVAALRDSAAASALATRLREDGFDARVLGVTPDDPFYRVRTGRALTRAQAVALEGRLTRAGYSPFILEEGSNGGR